MRRSIDKKYPSNFIKILRKLNKTIQSFLFLDTGISKDIRIVRKKYIMYTSV